MTKPADRHTGRSHRAIERVGRLLAGVTCALCLLGLLATIALASPGKSTLRHTRAHRPSSCRRSARAHKHRRASRCPVRKRRPAHATPTESANAPTSNVTPTVATPAPPAPESPAFSAPALSSPAPAPALPDPTEPPTSTPPSVPHVQVIAVEYRFTLSRPSVPAGSVVFDFVNHGQDEHNLNARPPEGQASGLVGSTPSEGMGQLEVQLKPGTYTLFCSLAGHEQKGMKATLTVE